MGAERAMDFVEIAEVMAVLCQCRLPILCYIRTFGHVSYYPRHVDLVKRTVLAVEVGRLPQC